MKKFNKYVSIVFLTTGLLFGCEEKLDVDMENNPDFAKIFATGSDVESAASGIYNSIFKGDHSAGGVHAMMSTAADHVTVSWGNFGFRDMSWEPRDFAWNNQPTYANQGQTKYSYDQWYSAIGTASNVLKAVEDGVKIGVDGADAPRTLAFAKFSLGVAYGNLALVFDKAHIVDNKITVEESIESASSYTEVANAAIGYFEEALTLADNDFILPASWLGTPSDLSSGDFKKIIYTHAARLLAYMPRNSTELAAVNWAKVKEYADKGITEDWIITMDSNDPAVARWYFEAGDYETYPGWGRTDMRVVHMMEPSLPEHWDDVATFPHPAEPATSLDARLKTDFQYMASNDFNPTRGYYHFTCYRSLRYDELYANGTGDKPNIMLAENEMLRAEARAYTGDLSGAADIINEGTRITRGEMDPVGEDLDEIIKAIHHERHVELYTTGMGIQFFEMRKLDLLQKGTPLHLPIPGQTLQLFGLTTFYTFGTTAKADGVSTSDKGWR